jgi:apolipoprotein N-acyltransferase
MGAPPAAVLGGVLAGLALPPLGWPPLLWLALVPLWAAGPRAAALWAAAAVLVSHRWLLWLHPLDWVGVPLPLSLPLCLLLWLGCGLAGALLVGGWSLLVSRLGPRHVGTALLGAGLWGLAEVLLSSGPLFWIGLGVAPLPGDRALAGVAALGGAGLVAALQLLLGWFLWRALLVDGGRRGWWLAAGLAAVVVLHGVGWAQLRPEQAERGPPLRPLVLQPAIPTREKFEPARQRRLLERLAAARGEAAERGVGPLLLPEGSLVLAQPLPSREPVEVLSGGFRQEGEEVRSAVLRFGPGDVRPIGWVDKVRVVPLGEWVPFARLWRWSGLSAVGGIEPGAPSRLLLRPGGPVGVAICYELSDGRALAAAVRDGAGWLMASANLDPYPRQLQEQFAALARLRAIETGRWLVSSANTGPSLVADGQGRVRQELPRGRPASGVLQLEILRDFTPYTRWGEAPLLLMSGGGLMLRLFRPLL